MDARTAKSVLILEDEPLIALEHDEIVERAGFTQVTIFSTWTAANEWLQFNTPTVALLDVRLRDGPCAAVATLLRNKGIPLSFVRAQAKRTPIQRFAAAFGFRSPVFRTI
jgi:DNA-binding response OmpR family regulator